MGSDARRKADAHHKMGIMRYRQGILQAAIHQLRAALSVDPAHEPSYAALAAIYIEMRFWDEALDVCRQGLQRCKQRAQLHKLTIDALGLRGSLADAFAHYQLRPTSATCRHLPSISHTQESRLSANIDSHLDDKNSIFFDSPLCLVHITQSETDLSNFFAHYRALGVSDFIGLWVSSGEIPDTQIPIWHAPTTDPNALIELLLRKFGVDRWCLSVTSNELLVYRDFITHPVYRFCNYLQRNGWRGASAGQSTPLFRYDPGLVLDEEGNFLNMPDGSLAIEQIALVASVNEASEVVMGLSAEKQPRRFTFPPIQPVPLQPGRPLFSIMITVYDRLETVKRAIRSVAAQLAPDMHVEIVNDGSLLRSQLETFLAKLDDDRITLSCTDEPLGHPHIFNHCIERAKGEWVHILHDDDWVDPHLYEHLRQGIDSAPEVGALLCYHRIVGNASTTGRTMYAYPERETAGIIDGWLERIVVDCRLQFSSIVVRRSAYERVGGFSAECGSAFDWEMWKRLAVHFPVWYDPAMLVPIGRGDGSALTDTLQRSGKQTIDSAQTIAISKSYLPPDVAERLSEKASEALALRGLHLARLFSKRHDYEAVVANLNAALRVCPTPAIQRRATQLLQTIYE